MPEPDLDLRLGHIAVRMGVIRPQDLPALLQEARVARGSGSSGVAFGQLLLAKKLISASDYLYMARQAGEEEKSAELPSRAELKAQVAAFESGDVEQAAFEAWMSSSGEQLTPPPRVSRFGPFELLDEIARGGMGIVYRAKDTKNRIVALKVMIEADDDEIRLQRFEREAELAAALEHPHIVRIHDAGRVDGIPYFTMDLVDGDSLDDLLEGEGIAREKALLAISQIAKAMDHAHERGIIHRDLKPGNILIDKKAGTAHVTDFGLARDLQRLTRLTQVGQAVGTPYYMSPEQVRGERDVDGRADVYALGVILYEVLTGDVPFDADSPLSLFKKIDREPVVLNVDESVGIDPRIHAIVMKALHKDRNQRYARGRHLAEDLERYLRGSVPRALREGFGPRALDWLRQHRGALTVAALGSAAVLVIATAGTLTWQRFSALARSDEARARVGSAIAGARQAGEEASRALGKGNGADASQRAEAALAALGALETDKNAPDPVGAAAREAWEAGQGAALLAELRQLGARSLARLAKDDPAQAPRAEAALKESLARTPGDAGTTLLLAGLYEDAGRFGEALDALDAALEQNPHHGGCLLARARIRLRRGEAVAASADLSAALMRDPKEPAALVLRAEAYRQLGRLDAAQGDAEEALKLLPGDPAPHLALGDVARARGLPREALPAYEQAARLADQDPRPHLSIGELLLSRGAWEAGLLAFARAAERAPQDPLAAAGKVRALLGLFRVDEARAAAEEALRREQARPGEARAALLEAAGAVALAAGDLPAARDAFFRATSAWPQAVAARLRLLSLLLHPAGEDGLPGLPAPAGTAPSLAEAEGLIQALRQARPEEDPDLLCARAAVALARGESGDTARELGERALAATRGTHPLARRLLARARLQVDRSSPAARAACAAAWNEELEGEGPAGELLRSGLQAGALGRAHGQLELQTEARARLVAALRLEPELARAWVELGELALVAGEPDVAWELLRRAELLDPWRVEVGAAMARVALAAPDERERVAQALAALARGLEVGGPTADRLGLRAELQAALGRWSDALGELEEALRLEERSVFERRRGQALAELGRPAEATRARTRAQALAEEEEAAGGPLLLEAAELRQKDRDAARELLLRAARKASPEWSQASREALLAAAALHDGPVERLECLAPLLLLSDPSLLAQADELLAAVWATPLAREPRRDLLRRARDGGAGPALAVAVAAHMDALAGETDPAWLEEGLEHAAQALGEVPTALALHAARTGLRSRAGDPVRALRELEPAGRVAPRASLLLFVRAEALARTGDTAGAAAALEEALQQGLPAAEERKAKAGL